MDILMLSALENVTIKEVVEKSSVRLICEAANELTTSGADKGLEKRGIPLTSNILINFGRVIVLYFKWIQNLWLLLGGR